MLFTLASVPGALPRIQARQDPYDALVACCLSHVLFRGLASPTYDDAPVCRSKAQYCKEKPVHFFVSWTDHNNINVKGCQLFLKLNLPVLVVVPDLIPPFAAITHPAVPPPISNTERNTTKNL